MSKPAKSAPVAAASHTTRWKIACGVLAVLAGGSLLYPRGSSANTPAPVAQARRASLPAQLRRPLHVSAEAAGVSRADLVDRILHARTVRDVATLADKLGAVGDDEAVDALAPLLTDT
ncbi:MAG TPA: hypothetical protein VFP84_34165, partial [Kofleriaceae bacterium]|nr:hypothetical protein [Kofleriaceae bacterium]